MASVQFSIRMDPDIKSRLDAQAKLEDRSAAYITQRALDAYLKRKEHLQKILQESEIEAEKGAFVSSDAVNAWLDSWDTANELPMPEADTFRAK